MMNVLVTGAYGQLGSEIVKLSGLYPRLKIMATDADSLDITNQGQLTAWFEIHKPGFVVNCAAYTNVDNAEGDIENATLVNSTAPGILSKVCHSFSAKLIHVSTDYVFQGKGSRPYLETDKVDPLGVYGKTKLDGEVAALQNNPDVLILRTSWLYSVFGKNFVKTIIKYAREKGSLNVVSDQVGSPTNACDLATAILTIITSSLDVETNFIPGIYHFSNEGECSWYDFAVAIINFAGISCQVKPVSSSEYKTKAKRPFYSVLDKTKIKTNYNLSIPGWQESLKGCVQEIIKNNNNGEQ